MKGFDALYFTANFAGVFGEAYAANVVYAAIDLEEGHLGVADCCWVGCCGFLYFIFIVEGVGVGNYGIGWDAFCANFDSLEGLYFVVVAWGGVPEVCFMGEFGGCWLEEEDFRE